LFDKLLSHRTPHSHGVLAPSMTELQMMGSARQSLRSQAENVFLRSAP
jgi:hypothetical protein